MRVNSTLTRLEREARKRVRPADDDVVLVVVTDAAGNYTVTPEQRAKSQRLGLPVIIIRRPLE